ncbi:MULTISPECIES: helix-turn-helix domain-containing protein [Chryseobacterium]|uniref:AraC-like DNA-binding protein n=1 Tax=Chryseobacterium camelliae TaxID=1265445 RepID=A0ABU0TFQ5_9FLAO|nr:MULTISPECIES: helix-turn-helix domain-containing protein [Chryseobacterium]MDT3406311.1 AraC-like DNA-binding protein [Pseudacidovorax intermedius]MDQ1095890.1 AraC-like DNA-binding protein [Chryseobacterium camelliae]MDQ1099827.1 AraC-like DNA-binding protein [Chryseobacterium sp. SORGH_AS_1048]MDR6087173.1 AraC-like DNA-binding protein [Chryseobacterium sp. SORGH_AS_0909]MDR6131546.1 AraC-like DNA-binding protein [Chryseobacterium sp. SORGH_AS_1175]
MTTNHIYTKTTDFEYLNMPVHVHNHHHQFVYMIKGTLRINLCDKEFFLPEGFIGIIPSGTMHSLKSNNEKIKMFLLYVPPITGNNDYSALNANDFIIENMRFLNKLKRELNPDEDAVHYQFCYAFSVLLCSMARESDTGFVRGMIAPKNERLQAVLSYLKEHFHEENSLKKISGIFGFTPRNLTRIFKKENISFVSYINYLRIVKAIELLSENHGDISSVAYEVGYNSASNFSRAFKKFTGHSPSYFVKNNRTWSIK